jgi:hypothetical protein
MLAVAQVARYRQPVFARQPEVAGIARATRAIQGAVYYTDSQFPFSTSEESDKVTAMVAMSTKGRGKYTITSGVEGAAVLCASIDKPSWNVADPKRLIVLTGAPMLDQPWYPTGTVGFDQPLEEVRAR